MHKHTMTMPKPWPHAVSFGAHLHELVANLKKAFEIPTGYEDETGFHLGAEPAEKAVKWPAAW